VKVLGFLVYIGFLFGWFLLPSSRFISKILYVFILWLSPTFWKTWLVFSFSSSPLPKSLLKWSVFQLLPFFSPLLFLYSSFHYAVEFVEILRLLFSLRCLAQLLSVCSCFEIYICLWQGQKSSGVAWVFKTTEESFLCITTKVDYFQPRFSSENGSSLKPWVSRHKCQLSV